MKGMMFSDDLYELNGW